MRGLTQITNHGEQAFERLPQFFKDGGNFGLVVRTLAERWNRVEQELFNILIGRYLANATGATLNQIGHDVGEDRPLSGPAATNDDQYRVLIYGRIGANISHGTRPDLLKILGLLQVGSPKIMSVYPAALKVDLIPTALLENTTFVRDILTMAKASVAVDITQHSAAPFGFEGDPDAFGFDDGELGGVA